MPRLSEHHSGDFPTPPQSQATTNAKPLSVSLRLIKSGLHNQPKSVKIVARTPQNRKSPCPSQLFFGTVPGTRAGKTNGQIIVHGGGT